MAFENFGAAFVANPIGQISVAYLSRQTQNQISLLDTTTTSAPSFTAYRSHVVTGEGDKRDTRKRIKRLNVYGVGMITVGQIIICTDNRVTESYPYSPIPLAGAMPVEGILIQQGCAGSVGRTFDITILLMGSGIEIYDIEPQFVEVG